MKTLLTFILFSLAVTAGYAQSTVARYPNGAMLHGTAQANYYQMFSATKCYPLMGTSGISAGTTLNITDTVANASGFSPSFIGEAGTLRNFSIREAAMLGNDTIYIYKNGVKVMTTYITAGHTLGTNTTQTISVAPTDYFTIGGTANSSSAGSGLGATWMIEFDPQ